MWYCINIIYYYNIIIYIYICIHYTHCPAFLVPGPGLSSSSLIGLCFNTVAWLCIYMQVDNHLLWKERVNILLGTARALFYLHPTFPHYNLKSYVELYIITVTIIIIIMLRLIYIPQSKYSSGPPFECQGGRFWISDTPCQTNRININSSNIKCVCSGKL